MAASIFVSYSHQDFFLVHPVVSLLRGAVETVFTTQQAFNERQWKEEVERAIRESDPSHFSGASIRRHRRFVRSRYKLAVDAAKDVVTHTPRFDTIARGFAPLPVG